MKKIETYELTHLYKQLVDISKKDMTASGIHIEMKKLDGCAIGEMDFIGEMLPELIPILLKSLNETLILRASQARDDLMKIDSALAKRL